MNAGIRAGCPPERILAIVETAVGDVHGGTYKRLCWKGTRGMASKWTTDRWTDILQKCEYLRVDGPVCGHGNLEHRWKFFPWMVEIHDRNPIHLEFRIYEMYRVSYKDNCPLAGCWEDIPKIEATAKWVIVDGKNTTLMIEALVDPEKMPLCVGIECFVPVMERWAKIQTEVKL